MTLSVGIAFGALAISLCMLVIAFANFILTLTKNEEGKRARIYERIDETKKSHDAQIKEIQEEARGGFVLKDLCLLQHNGIKDDLIELKKDIKFVAAIITKQKMEVNDV